VAAVIVVFSDVFLVSLAFCFFSAMEKKRGLKLKDFSKRRIDSVGFLGCRE